MYPDRVTDADHAQLVLADETRQMRNATAPSYFGIDVANNRLYRLTLYPTPRDGGRYRYCGNDNLNTRARDLLATDTVDALVVGVRTERWGEVEYVDRATVTHNLDIVAQITRRVRSREQARQDMDDAQEALAEFMAEFMAANENESRWNANNSRFSVNGNGFERGHVAGDIRLGTHAMRRLVDQYRQRHADDDEQEVA